MFDLSGPPLQELVEGVDYVVTMRHKCMNPQDLCRTKEQGNKGNRFAKGPPKGSKNNVKHYWYKTPTEEGTCIGKDTLVQKGFPPSIYARRHDHYRGGTSYRNMKWKHFEYKTL